MSVTVIVNNLTLAHKGSNGTAIATVPDVCKTPSPSGPIPMPYPNIAMSADLVKGTTTVKADGGNMIANKGAELCKSSGDEAGTAGGITSSTFIKEATWMLYSFDVMFEGKNACRLTDKLFMNHQNTVCLAGWLQAFLAANKHSTIADACKAMGEYIDDMIGEGRKGEGKKYTGRGLEERMNQNQGIGLRQGNPGSKPGTPGWQTHDDEIRKLQNDLGEKLDEYEEECKDHAGRRDFKARTENGRDWQNRPRPTAADWEGP